MRERSGSEGADDKPEGGSARGRLVVITGTGTSIGKTHLAEALVLAWTRTARVVGLKPIESGVGDGAVTDAARLRAVSSFHVKRSGYTLSAPLSPHLAARDEGIEISADVIVELVEEARQQADGIVVELAGGLFTPIADGLCNADLAIALAADTALLVAPDRLGVLHDVAAAMRAVGTTSLRIDGVVLVAPDRRDASTGRNAAELPRVSGVPVLVVLPRAPPAELVELPSMKRLVEIICGDTGRVG
jgi:dethiobiotin synthetase